MMLAEQYLSWLSAIEPPPPGGATPPPPAARDPCAAAPSRAAALPEQHHVISAAAPVAGQHGLHRAWRQILSAMGRMGGIRCSLHRQDMAAAGFGDKAHAGPGSGP